MGSEICIAKMSSFKFDQKVNASEDFHKQRQVTDIFSIDVNKVVLSDVVSCNNGKERPYIVDYQVERRTMIPLFIKTPKNILSYGVSQYDRNLAHTVSFIVSEVLVWVLHYRNIYNKIGS